MLKKQRGNMYTFVTHMWSPIRGKCAHDCEYCYMKKWGQQPPLHLDETDLLTFLGRDKFIFVGHTVDMFAEDVKPNWIYAVLYRLNDYPTNKYLLQSKNPNRMRYFQRDFPPKVLLATTIETNRDIVRSKAPPVSARADALHALTQMGFETMVTVEPIFDFDLSELVELILRASPKWVNIGADSKGHNLPEPSREKVVLLVKTLKEKTDVKLKGNLDRILKYIPEAKT